MKNRSAARRRPFRAGSIAPDASGGFIPDLSFPRPDRAP